MTIPSNSKESTVGSQERGCNFFYLNKTYTRRLLFRHRVNRSKILSTKLCKPLIVHFLSYFLPQSNLQVTIFLFVSNLFPRSYQNREIFDINIWCCLQKTKHQTMANTWSKSQPSQQAPRSQERPKTHTNLKTQTFSHSS